MAEYYVDNVTGNNTGNEGGSGDPWGTLASGLTSISANDKLWVKGGTDYAEAITASTYGTYGSDIAVEGYTTTTGDGGTFTLEGGGSLSNAFSTTQSAWYVRFVNMAINNYASTGFNCSAADYLGFWNCSFTNNGGYGAVMDNYNVFVDCVATGNSFDGVKVDAGNSIVGGKYSFNTQNGIFTNSNQCDIYGVEVVGNNGRGANAIYGAAIYNSTFDCSTGGTEGIFFGTNGTKRVVVNCIMYDCNGGGAIYCQTDGYNTSAVGKNNLLNSNDINYGNWNEHLQGTDIYDPPGFADEAGGDYTLASDSAARNAGADSSGSDSPGMDIGSHQSEDEGGGRVVIAG